MDVLILVVEDNALLRDSQSFGLRRAGYRVHAVGSMAEAVIWLRRNRPSLVLLDIGLPDGSGVTLGHWLRALRVPMAIVTGLSGAREMQLRQSLGAEDYILKPVAVEELAGRVAAILQRLPPAPPA